MTHVFVVVFFPEVPVIEKVYEPSGKEVKSVLVKVQPPVTELKTPTVEPEAMLHKSVRGLEAAIAHEQVMGQKVGSAM